MCPDYFDGGFINSSCTRKLKAVCEYSCDSELLQHPTIHSLTCVRLGEWIHGGDDNSDLDILCTGEKINYLLSIDNILDSTEQNRFAEDKIN